MRSDGDCPSKRWAGYYGGLWSVSGKIKKYAIIYINNLLINILFIKLKKVAGIFLAFILAFSLSVTSVSAAEFRVGEKTGGSISIGADEEIKNLYTAGNIVSVDANIEKGLHAAGNTVTVNGDVKNSIYVAGSTLVINGDIGGSVHGAGGTVVISSSITDDLFIGGGNVSLTKSASIGGDLILGAGTINIEAPVNGDVYIGGGEVFINSEIKGNVIIKEVENLKLGGNAIINGNLKYNSPVEAKIDDNASILGVIEYNTNVKQEGVKDDMAMMLFMIFSIGLLVKIVSMIIIGLIFIYLFKRYTTNTVNESLAKFWPSLGIGFATLFLTPVIIVLLLFSVIGIYLAIIVALTYILSLFIASALMPIIFGSWLVKIIKKEKSYKIRWIEVVVGVITLMIIGFIPVVGAITALILFLISLGAIYRLVYKTIK